MVILLLDIRKIIDMLKHQKIHVYNLTDRKSEIISPSWIFEPGRQRLYAIIVLISVDKICSNAVMHLNCFFFNSHSLICIWEKHSKEKCCVNHADVEYISRDLSFCLQLFKQRNQNQIGQNFTKKLWIILSLIA